MNSRIITMCLLACFMTFGTVESLHTQQSITIAFTGKNITAGLDQKLDSIQVKDLSRSFDSTLIGVQQLILSSVTGVDDADLHIPNRIVLSNNFGNPFTDKTSFYVTTAEATNITLEVFNVLGKNIIGSTTTVEAGVHRFLFVGNALEPGVYYLTARVGSYQSTTKMLKIDRGGNASPQLVYEGLLSGSTETPNGFRKASSIGDNYRFVGFAKGFVSDTIFAKPMQDTAYEFQLGIINTPPAITSFVADSYARLTGDSVQYTVSAKDTEGNLAKAWIDFNGDGVFDDSASVSGGDVVMHFKTAFNTPGSYLAKARVMDSYGLACEAILSGPIIVTKANTPPTIASFIADSYSKMTGDSVRYTVSAKDADGDLWKAWIDFNGDGVFDDSTSISGGSVLVYFKTSFKTPGSFTAKARAMDSKGLTCELSLSNPVIVLQANTPPSIVSFIADAYAALTDDTVHYTISVKDAEGNLLEAWIDFDGDGVFDDSTSVSGGDALVKFKTVFTTPGSYPAKARAMDSRKLTCEKSLPASVTITQKTPEIINIDPDSIAVASEIKISGKHFGDSRGVNAVFFNGGAGGTQYLLSATYYRSWSDTAIILHAPAGIDADGVLYVTVDGRTSNEYPYSLRTTVTISGIISGNGVVVSGIVVRAEAVMDTLCSALTDGSGRYSIGNVPNDGYVIEPAKSGVQFSPEYKVVDVSDSDIAQINFTASAMPPYTSISFNPNLTYGAMTDIDGNVYKTIQIGNQIWMAENLKTTKYSDGTPIPLIADSLVWGNLLNPTAGYCWYNNDSGAYRNPYGALYNWIAVNSGKLAPVGWHVPADAEWHTLMVTLDSSAQLVNQTESSTAGGKMKETGNAHWSALNVGADNGSGFTALPGGYRADDGTFGYLRYGGFWWSSTNYDASNAWFRAVSNLDAGTWRDNGDLNPGFSVRCVKN